MGKVFDALKEHLQAAVKLVEAQGVSERLKFASQLDVVSRHFAKIYFEFPRNEWDEADEFAHQWMINNESVPATRESALPIIGKPHGGIRRVDA